MKSFNIVHPAFSANEQTFSYIRCMLTLFVDELTIADFSYLHPKRGLLGESWLVDLELTGEADSQGFILDFGIVKKEVKRWIDTYVDHRLLVPVNHPNLILNHTAVRLDVRFESEVGVIEMRSPIDAVCEIPAENVDPITVKSYIEHGLREIMPENVTGISITLREEVIRGPYYHYSHGLKKHNGNCQRIAHGHRSKIQVFENGTYSEEWSIYWAQKLKDIYIGTEADIVHRDDQKTTYFYRSDQGEFELTIPTSATYNMPSDTTVENIARHLSEETRALTGGSNAVKVRAFEGVHKGSSYNDQAAVDKV